jgi:hypothetical protein
MSQLAAPGQDAPRRLPDDDTQQFVLRTVATHAESLLRTAERHSLCEDDAHDAYQRGLEIFMRRAADLDRKGVDRWLHVVVKQHNDTLTPPAELPGRYRDAGGSGWMGPSRGAAGACAHA